MANNPGLALMKNLINQDALKARAEQALGAAPGTFLASVLELYSSDSYLAQCDPNAVMKEAMKAASLRLPVNKALGFAYILPYKVKGVMTPTFILGYRGMVQLAQRTGLYRAINADCVYEGERAVYNRVTGDLTIEGEATSDKAIGYFAYLELLNGFKKAVFWSRKRVEEHARKYSRAFGNGPWQSDFDAMACKTVLRQLLSKYGVMSVEFAQAMAADQDERTADEVAANANAAPLELPEMTEQVVQVVEHTPAQETAEPAPAEVPAPDAEPDF